MRTCKGLKEIILKCDLFKTTEYFRYKGEPQYRTLTGGVCSLALVVIFAIVFAQSILATLAKSRLAFGYNLIQNTTDSLTITCSTKNTSKFMFAVGLDEFNLNSGEQYFDIRFAQIEIENGVQTERQIKLEPCERSVWEGSNDEILQIYDRYNFSRLLCPPEDSNFTITGSETNKNFKYIKISAVNCSSNPSLTCANSTTIDNYLAMNPNFRLRLYFVNGLFNPSQPQEITYYLQDRNSVPFNTLYGGQSNIYMSRYSVTTDQSITPWQDSRVNAGGVVNFVGQYLASRVFKDEYAQIKIRKSHVSWDITRIYTKLDNTLSYIGGLFGFIMVAFIFLQIYTEYSYEIEMGDKLYYYDSNTPLNSSKFNFLTFIGYLFYSIVDFFGCAWQSDSMKKFKASRQEIQKQFDICFLMKRIIFFQRSLRILFEDHQFKGLHMHEKLTLKEAQQLRSYYRLRDKLKVSLDDKAETRPVDQDSDFSQSKESNEINYTQDILHNELFESADRGPEINSTAHRRSSKTRKVHPIMDMSDQSKKIICSESVFNAKTTQNFGETSQSHVKRRSADVQSKLKILRTESESGNSLSRKIFQGVDSELVRNILLRLSETAQQAQHDPSEIIICQHEEEFEIRISKRREREPVRDTIRQTERDRIKSVSEMPKGVPGEQKIKIQLDDSELDDSVPPEKEKNETNFDYLT